MKKCAWEVVEPLLGDAVTISICLRFLSHGLTTHTLPTSILFIFLTNNVVYSMNLSAKPIFCDSSKIHTFQVRLTECDWAVMVYSSSTNKHLQWKKERVGLPLLNFERLVLTKNLPTTKLVKWKCVYKLRGRFCSKFYSKHVGCHLVSYVVEQSSHFNHSLTTETLHLTTSAWMTAPDWKTLTQRWSERKRMIMMDCVRKITNRMMPSTASLPSSSSEQQELPVGWLW